MRLSVIESLARFIVLRHRTRTLSACDATPHASTICSDTPTITAPVAERDSALAASSRANMTAFTKKSFKSVTYAWHRANYF